jgi:hypothetical protein
VVGGLIQGGHYQFRMAARNSVGWGAISNHVSAKTALMAPSAPTISATSAGPNEIQLNWTEPAFTGGAPIIDYGYQISPDGGATWIGGWAGPASARSTVIGGLIQGGHYQFRMAARNSVSWGAVSNVTSAIPTGSFATTLLVIESSVDASPRTPAIADPTTSGPTTSASDTTIPTTVTTTELRGTSAAAATDAPTIGDASIGDLVWLDTDADGIQDVGEPGAPAVIVRLIDAGGAILDEDVSDAQGGYDLAPPSAGAFSLEVVLADRYEPTLVDVGPDDALDSDLDPADVVIGPVETSGRIDFEHAGGADVDLDIGLVAVPEEASTTQTTTTTGAPVPTETTTTIPAPTTQPPTTATAEPTAPTVPNTQPPTSTKSAVSTSGPVG